MVVTIPPRAYRDVPVQPLAGKVVSGPQRPGDRRSPNWVPVKPGDAATVRAALAAARRYADA